jgi:hypothetical protein
MQNQKGISTLTGIIIIVVVAVVLFGGVFAYQYFATKSKPKVVQTQTQTAGWKTYTNTQYGFKFSVPEWVDKYNSGSGIYDAYNIIGIGVGVLSKNQSMQDYINQSLISQGIIDRSSSKNIVIDGRNGIRVDYESISSPASGLQTDIYVPLNSGNILYMGISDEIFNQGDTNALNKFLENFKFTK